MKTIILIALFASFGAIAQDNSFSEGEMCTTKNFTGTSSSFRGDSCDMWVAETHALNKCRRTPGYKNCHRKAGRQNAYVIELGSGGQECVVIVKGEKNC